MFVHGANGAVGGYNLKRSLRFRASASAYLNRTPASATNRRTWTLSCCVKRGSLGTLQGVFTGKLVKDDTTSFYYSSDKLNFLDRPSNVTNISLSTDAVYRDPSAWYHVVLAVDTTNATSTDRIKIYVNNTRQTLSGTYPSLNYEIAYINNTQVQALGVFQDSSGLYFDSYMTEVNFIDGQALTPASFGETNALTGVWQFKAYTGTYGTNGFYLDFEDTSSVAALGTDKSGNGNTWTVNNVSLTAGVTYDSMTDVPTLTSATAANYAVLNRILPAAGLPDIRDANLYLRCADASNFTAIPATMLLPKTGKWYAEFTAIYVDGTTSILDVGLLDSTDFPTPSGVIGASSKSYGYRNTGSKLNNGAATAYGASYVIGDIIAIAFDATAGTLTFYKNNVSQGVAFTGLTAEYFFAIGGYNFAQWAANFGQRPFAYTPPTGFVALNAYNLPDATIKKGSDNFNVVLDTGANIKTTTEALYPSNFFEWIKDRANANNHQLIDSVRGSTAVLQSNTTAAETTYSAPSGNSVGFAWKAGGAAISNTAGSITSQVSANASAGCSVVTYPGTGANATVGHGLGVAPKMIILKSRGGSGTNWTTYHASLGATQYIFLNLTNAAATASTVFNNTAPTSSVFSLGTDGNANTSTRNHVAYCFAEIDGFSKFGSYTGNSNADGPFIYLGFRPKFVLFKGSSFANNWYIIDSTTNTINVAGAGLKPNASDAEIATSTTQNAVDFLSNGFKLRNDASAVAFNNSSGQTFIYAAFAENPFKNSLAR